MAKKSTDSSTIIVNRKARHDYELGECFEAGLVLDGWEVKSLRAGKAQVRDSYVIIKDGELWLLGMVITPLPTASAHSHPDPQRTRKLLLHRQQIAKLIGLVERKGFTLVPVKLYWKRHRAKVQIAQARGKKAYDKRQALKDRDWQRQKEQIRKGL